MTWWGVLEEVFCLPYVMMFGTIVLIFNKKKGVARLPSLVQLFGPELQVIYCCSGEGCHAFRRARCHHMFMRGQCCVGVPHVFHSSNSLIIS